jgi:hypothetical protein
VSEIEGDIRATAEDLAEDAHRVLEIEQAKAHLEVDDPRMVELSAESERIARRMVPKTVAERELVDDVATG